MRAHIFGAPSPVHVTQSPYVFASPVWMRAFAAVLLVVFVGGGTASAAQGALPGDLLYPVKVSINEKVEAALTSNVAAKAEVEAKFAERRIEEAQALASQDRLDTPKADMIAAKFELHAQVAEALADSVEAEEPGTVVKVKTALASALQVQSEVLEKLGRLKGAVTKQNSAALATRVIARADSSGPGSANTRAMSALAPSAKSAPTEDAAVQTMSLSVGNESGVSVAAEQKAAAALQKKAGESLAETTKLFDAAKAKFDATTTAQIAEQLSFANEAMSQGSTTLGAEGYAEAKAHFAEALRLSARLKALLEAERKYDNGLLQEILKGVQLNIPVPTEGPAPEREVEREIR